MKKLSLGALVASGLLIGGLTASSASAADLGGNCCADLEERIAELEATTARKGNRKVSLTISGWVGEQVIWWDDGSHRQTLVTGLGTTLASHVTFSGQATILPGWYAGYVLQLEMNENDPLVSLSQNHSVGPIGFAPGEGLPNVFYSYWFVKSDHLGKVSVGLQSSAGDNAAILVDGSGSLVPANWVTFDNGNFFIRNKFNGQLSNLTWNGLGFCNVGFGANGDCVGTPENLIRYDSPAFAGFSLSADWGQDTYWDIYGRYAGEWNGIKVAATAGWSEVNGCRGNQNAGEPFGFLGTGCINSPTGSGFLAVAGPSGVTSVPFNFGGLNNNITGDVGYFQAGAYIEHVATGLWLYGAYGKEFLSDMPGTFTNAAGFVVNGSVLNSEPDHWYVKGGLRERWTSLGHSVLYGFYGQRNDMLGAGAVAGDNIVGSRMTEWGLGAVQEIDAAAMSLWVQYDHFHGDVSCGVGGCGTTVLNGTATTTGTAFVFAPGVIDLQDSQLVKAGALINF